MNIRRSWGSFSVLKGYFEKENKKVFLMTYLIALSSIICICLLFMVLILLVNFLLRPILWTYVNIIIMIYYCLLVILSLFNIKIITNIVSENILISSSSNFEESINNQKLLQEDCVLFIYWSGTWVLRKESKSDWWIS